MRRHGRVLLGLMLVWSLIIFSLNSPADGEDQNTSASGGSPAVGEHGDLSDLARHLNNPVGPVWN
jgi:hypothetical protein